MTIKELKDAAAKIQALTSYNDRRRSRVAFLDANFKEAYRWNLANKILDEIEAFGTNRADDEIV